MLAAIAAAYFAISLYFAVDAALKIHHALQCPGCGADSADIREITEKLGRRGVVALYMLIIGLALALWPLFVTVKLLVGTKGES